MRGVGGLGTQGRDGGARLFGTGDDGVWRRFAGMGSIRFKVSRRSARNFQRSVTRVTSLRRTRPCATRRVLGHLKKGNIAYVKSAR